MTTPIGGGIRSLNVALRQINDLYACVRPCKYYAGTPSPHRSPEKLDVIIYRENTEDIYLGIKWKQGDPICDQLIKYLNTEQIPATPEHGKKQIQTRPNEYSSLATRDCLLPFPGAHARFYRCPPCHSQ